MDTSVLNELLIKCSDVFIGQLGRATPNDTVAIVSNVPHIIEESCAEVRKASSRGAERNKRYYDCKVRSQKYSVRQWVYYFNPRKFQGKQMKWM